MNIIRHPIKNNYETTIKLALFPYLSIKIPIKGDITAPSVSTFNSNKKNYIVKNNK